VTADNEEDHAIYSVVVNNEEQYSIWPSHLPMPRGWRSVGKEALKAECLRYIDDVWTDMRPLSLRRKMERESRAAAAGKEFDIDP
jgi:MbtH protein